MTTIRPELSDDRVADLYLDVLQRALTGSLQRAEFRMFEPGQAWQRTIWSLIRRVLQTKRLDVIRSIPINPEDRAEGRDWPASAETMVGLRRLENLRHLVRVIVREDIKGDLLEAGTWRGGAAIFMRGALEAYGDRDRQVWVADSFQGLPRPDPARYPADAGDTHWTWSQLAVPLGDVRDNFARYNLLDDRVRFLPGWFKDTLSKAPIDHLALLRVDGDLYESTLDTLTALYDKVSAGGFVVIDDYGCVPACKKAVEDFRAERKITESLEVIDWTGVYWRKQP